MNYLVNAILMGAGATLLLDAWAWLRRRVFGIPLPDYGLVGRWVGHMFRGRFRHEAIAAAPPLRGERLLGWTVHYLTGFIFAALLLGISRPPGLFAAVSFGLATVAAPFLLMQPGMGAGIAASRTRRPGAARLQSLVTHAVFGLGLYLAGSLLPLIVSA
jgi:hypothetical protein